VHALRDWVVDGTAPPRSPRFEVAGNALARDSRGIVQGGIRTAAVDAPVSVLSGEAGPNQSIICMLFGTTTPLDQPTLKDLYPTHDDYVAAVTSSTNAAVEDGFLLQPEADAVIAAAEDADVPG
jgi:alpha/beta hydrolase family protein